MPRYALVFMVFLLASVGLPGTSGFVGEFLSMQGTFMVNSWVASLAAVGMVLGAAYMLRLYRRLFYGPLDKPDVAALTDLTPREYAMFVPLLVIVVWMGVHPADFKNWFAPKITQMVQHYEAAKTAQISHGVQQ